MNARPTGWNRTDALHLLGATSTHHTHRVRVLTDTGFRGRFGKFMVDLAGGSVWGQSLAFGFVSALLVNVLNDLPSTVCWASMLPILCESYAPRHFHVVLQALLVGVNPGTYLSIVSGVVGWRSARF